MSILKNPIILALLTSALAFVITVYMYKDTNKNKSKKGKKIKNKKVSSSKETAIIVAAITGLGTWYIVSSYLVDNITEGNNEQKLLNSVPENPTTTNVQRGGNIPHISSDDPTRSYSLIGSGLNIPRSELKIPKVLIDCN